MLGPLALVAAAHALLIAWLAAQVEVLRFRAHPFADHGAVLIELRPLPSAGAHARPVVRPPPTVEPLPEPESEPSGPATIDEGAGSSGVSNLARPVFLDWPHPVPPGVDWGPRADAPRELALAGAWAGCRRAHDRDEDAWTPASRVKPPCLKR